jgi:replicative DNA helicase
VRDNEELFLACVLTDPQIIHESVLLEDHFQIDLTRKLYKAMQRCADIGCKIDAIALHDVDPDLDQYYMAALQDRIPSAANWKHWQSAVIADSQRTRIKALGRKLAAVTDRADVDEYINLAEEALVEIMLNRDSRQVKLIGEYLPAAMHEIERRHQSGGSLQGLTTGITGLDMLTGGLQDRRMIVIGARPSEGKSALALNMACAIAIGKGIPVGFVSAESSAQEVTLRTIIQTGHISGGKIQSGILSQADFSSLIDAGRKIQAAPIAIHDAPNLGIIELKAKAREMVIVHKIKALFVDYIQIVEAVDRKVSKHEQVAAVSLSLKQLARDLSIPVVALAQLSRNAEGREPANTGNKRAFSG